jgi:hypothetical protein
MKSRINSPAAICDPIVVRQPNDVVRKKLAIREQRDEGAPMEDEGTWSVTVRGRLKPKTAVIGDDWSGKAALLLAVGAVFLLALNQVLGHFFH